METEVSVARSYAEAVAADAAELAGARETGSERTAHSAMLMVSSSFGVAVLNYALNIILGWNLTNDEYGRVGVSQTIIFICVWFLGAGFPWVVTRALAQAKGEGPQGGPAGAHAWRTFKTAWVANSTLTVGVVVLLLAIYSLGWLPLERSYTPLIIIAAATILALGVGSVPDAGLQGLFRFGRISAVRVSEGLANILLSVALVMLGFGAPGALGGFAAAAFLAAALNVLLILDKRFWTARGWGGLSTVKQALPMTLAVFGGVLLTNIDLLAIKFLTGPNSDAITGTYQVAVVLARAPFFVATALVSTYYPRIARDAMEHKDAISGRELLRWLALIVLPLNTILLAAAPAVVAFFFPARYSEASGALAVLSVGSGALAVASALAAILQATGRARTPAAIMTLAVTAQVVGLVLLVPRYGIMGAAGASCGAALLACASLIWTGHRLGLAPRGVIKQALALGALAAVVLPLGLLLPGSSRVLVALYVALAGLFYAALLFLLGLLRADDLSRSAHFPTRGPIAGLVQLFLKAGAALNRIGGQTTRRHTGQMQ